MNERLKELRKSLNLTLKDFGKHLGVTDAAISRLEKGERNLTEQMLLAVCREFNVNEDWLRYGVGDMYSIQDDEYTKIVVAIDKGDLKARQAILDYWKLSPEDKELFWKFAERFLKGGI